MCELKINSIINTEATGVSHNSNIKKHVLINNGEIANVTNFSEAVFPPGEIAGSHSHHDMVEIFFIKSGKGVLIVDGVSHDIGEGMCITIDKNEVHELKNTGVSSLVVMCFGIEVN